MKAFETEIWIPAKNGVGISPRLIECPECGEPVRKRTGNRYLCECGADTTLDLTPLQHKRF
jgi:hypothetical protein